MLRLYRLPTKAIQHVHRRRRDARRARRWVEAEMGVARLAEFGLAHPDRVDHIPSFWWTLDRILPADEVRPDDVFLDLGSGMGRTVLAAATTYSFRRVTGVEISPELHKIALENVDRNHARLRSPVELVNADVLDYSIPDDVTVVYLYNPFLGDIFQHVLDALEASVDRNPRELRIVYLAPHEEQRLLASNRVTLVRSARAVATDDRSFRSLVSLYSLRPTSG
jgi:SAM-dependent methyltransferase